MQPASAKWRKKTRHAGTCRPYFEASIFQQPLDIGTAMALSLNTSPPKRRGNTLKLECTINSFVR